MDFTPRMQQILLIMLNEDKVISVKNLAERMNLSKRTVQRELEYLGRALKEYHVEFCSKTGTGVWLEGAREDGTGFCVISVKKIPWMLPTVRNGVRG